MPSPYLPSKMVIDKTIPIPPSITKRVISITVKKYFYPQTAKDLDVSITREELLSVLPRLGIYSLSDILPHEQTLPDKVKERTKELKVRKFWSIPAIDIALGEEGKALNLNGNHKEQAGVNAGLLLAPSLRHEYLKTPLGTFYPLISELSNDELRQLGGIGMDKGTAMQHLNARTAYFVAVRKTEGECFAFQCEALDSNVGLIPHQSKLLESLNKYEISFVEDSIFNSPAFANGEVAFVRNPFTRENVWEVARAGQLFPPKSTLHRFTYRAHVEISIKLLKGELERAEKHLQRAVAYLQDYLNSFEVV